MAIPVSGARSSPRPRSRRGRHRDDSADLVSLLLFLQWLLRSSWAPSREANDMAQSSALYVSVAVTAATRQAHLAADATRAATVQLRRRLWRAACVVVSTVVALRPLPGTGHRSRSSNPSASRNAQRAISSCTRRCCWRHWCSRAWLDVLRARSARTVMETAGLWMLAAVAALLLRRDCPRGWS